MVRRFFKSTEINQSTAGSFNRPWVTTSCFTKIIHTCPDKDTRNKLSFQDSFPFMPLTEIFCSKNRFIRIIFMTVIIYYLTITEAYYIQRIRITRFITCTWQNTVGNNRSGYIHLFRPGGQFMRRFPDLIMFPRDFPDIISDFFSGIRRQCPEIIPTGICIKVSCGSIIFRICPFYFISNTPLENTWMIPVT